MDKNICNFEEMNEKELS